MPNSCTLSHSTRSCGRIWKKLQKWKWNGWVHSREYQGSLSPRENSGYFSVLDQEWRNEWWRKGVLNGIKHLETQLFQNWKSQAQLSPMHLRSNTPETAVSAFSRTVPSEGHEDVMKILQEPFHQQQKGLLLAETSALLSNHDWVPSSNNKCWNSPFPRHSCFSSIVLQSLELFCGFVLVWAVSWISTHDLCLIDFSTMCSSLCHSTHTSSLHFPLGRQVWSC